MAQFRKIDREVLRERYNNVPPMMLDEIHNKTFSEWWDASACGYSMEWALREILGVIPTQEQRRRLAELEYVKFANESLSLPRVDRPTTKSHSDEFQQTRKIGFYRWAMAKGFRELLGNPFEHYEWS